MNTVLERAAFLKKYISEVAQVQVVDTESKYVYPVSKLIFFPITSEYAFFMLAAKLNPSKETNMVPVLRMMVGRCRSENVFQGGQVEWRWYPWLVFSSLSQCRGKDFRHLQDYFYSRCVKEYKRYSFLKCERKKGSSF